VKAGTTLKSESPVVVTHGGAATTAPRGRSGARDLPSSALGVSAPADNDEALINVVGCSGESGAAHHRTARGETREAGDVSRWRPRVRAGQRKLKKRAFSEFDVGSDAVSMRCK
jgi:cytochrome c5